MFLLDTDHISILQRTQPESDQILLRMAVHPPAAIYWSIVSLHEQSLGANVYINRAKTSAALVRGYEMYERILTDFTNAQVLAFDTDAESRFQALRQQRVRIGTMDLRIAATALSKDMTVVTRNLADFGKVPGLRTEDWTR